jgi:hypothetical protein
MDFCSYPSGAPFLEIVEADLVADEVANNLMYGLALQAVRSPGQFYTPPYFASVTEGGRLRVAAMMTPPNNLIVMAVEGGVTRAAMDRLANGLCESPWPGIPGVIGPAPAAIAFSQAWIARTGVKSSLRIHERLYELRKVIPPPQPMGRLRYAEMADLELMAGWLQAFHREALPNDNISYEEHLETARAKIAERDFYLWVDGPVVTLVGRSRPTPHGYCIGPVYTPPAFRRKGYATALTAEVSQMLLDSGKKFIALFTDLANPISNSIYQKIGYTPVCDVDLYEFS